eukprot:TRINITY_DN12200_c0_g1_i1.p1 TRINITY_DN12200_c0_g1~~TRINITY_DN12200_c0_g1_i1.p1  ORF type:complete len:756 (+),score=157.79 TRINITY_DN12200_c0_g1_i1:43-2268(+)
MGEAKNGVPEIEWIENTAEFFEQTKKLSKGVMIHDENFELSSVMHVIEMMGPNMDSGVGYKDILSLEEVIDGGLAKDTPSEEETMMLMEYLLKCEIAFLGGNYLPVTLFRCVYFHMKDFLKNEFLRSYLNAILASVVQYEKLALLADVTEEEEFQPHRFGVQTDVSPPQEVVAELEKLLEERKKEENPSVFATRINKLGELRIKFLKMFLSLAERELSAVQYCAETKALMRSLEKRGELDETHKITEENLKGIIFNEAGKWTIGSFECALCKLPEWSETCEKVIKILDEHHLMMQRLASPETMTLVELIEFMESFSAKKPHLLSRARLMCLVVEKNLIFGMKRMSDMVVEYFVKDLGCDLIGKVYEDDTVPTSLDIMNRQITREEKQQPVNSEANAALGFKTHREHMIAVIGRMGRCFLLHIYGLCHSRSKLRRKLANLFADWGEVQGMAWDLDKIVFDGNALQTSLPPEVSQRCLVFSISVFEWILRSMGLYLELGFELDLYSNCELQSIMWYIEYVSITRLQNLRNYHKEQELPKPVLQKYKARLKAANSKAQAIIPPIYAKRSLRPGMQIQILIGETLSYAQKGIIVFCEVCQNEGFLRDPGMKERREMFCTPGDVFNHRMVPFLSLHKPQFVRYETYKEHCCVFQGDSYKLLTDAKQYFSTCANTCHWHAQQRYPQADREKLMEVEKVCKANLLGVMLVCQMVDAKEKDPSLQQTVQIDWSYSRSLPVIKPAPKTTK